MARILRMSRALAFSVLLAAVAPVMAQKEFTLEDLNYGGTNYRNINSIHILQSFRFAKRYSVAAFSQRYLMVKSDKFAVFLP